MRKRTIAWLLALLCAASSGGSIALATTDCKLRAGEHVILYSSGDDPDVLAWDSRIRLRDYHTSSFDEAEQLLPHAVIEVSGTRASVVACVRGYVQSRLLYGPQDAVGVIILNGSDRGHGRWILGSDVRTTSSRRPLERRH